MQFVSPHREPIVFQVQEGQRAKRAEPGWQRANQAQAAHVEAPQLRTEREDGRGRQYGPGRQWAKAREVEANDVAIERALGKVGVGGRWEAGWGAVDPRLCA